MNRSATAPARSPPQPPPGATTPQRRPSRPRHASQLQTVRAVVKRVLLVSQTSAMASISNQELGEVQGLYPDQRRCGRRSESVGANTILASPGGRGSRTPRSNGPSARWEHVTARAIPLDFGGALQPKGGGVQRGPRWAMPENKGTADHTLGRVRVGGIALLHGFSAASPGPCALAVAQWRYGTDRDPLDHRSR
jgi:hypothetical protein